MPDAPPIICEQVLGTLRPANAYSAEAIKAIDGRCVVKVTKMRRNQRRRAWYWIMLDVVAQQLADTTGTPWDAETLHDDLRDRLKLGKPLRTPNGRTVWKRQSTSDRSMNEIERARWTDRVATYLSRQIGVEVHQLIDEVRARGGGEPDWREPMEKAA
ncbi:MAG: hypothetical protein ACOYBT_09805 [Polynucleobacter sp.]